MSAAEDYARLREDRRRGFNIPQEKKRPKYMVMCVECGKHIPLETGKVCCPECWAKINGRG